MKTIFEKITSTYNQEREKDIANNKLFNFITHDTEKLFYKTGIINSNQYLVKSSAGKGQWAIIPWIAIFDKDITTTAQKGYYIVYLFSADMKKIYLSLNQGWTYFKDYYGVKKGKEKIRIISYMLQEKLKSGLNEFNITDIDLEYNGNSSTLPKGYEMGHICGKVYEVDNLPDNKILINDLQNMISVYRELKGYILDNDYLILNNSLLAENIIETPKERRIGKESASINEILATEGVNTKLVKTKELPQIFEEVIKDKNEKYKLKDRETNYQQKNKNQENLGRAGEYYVLEYEKNRLAEKSINKKVEHVAITQKDQAGYDVKSYDDNGNEIYIEVKSTRKGINEPFYLTRNELMFSKKHKDRYFLYRVYNLNPIEKTGDFYIIHGDVSNVMNLEPEIYIANGRKG